MMKKQFLLLFILQLNSFSYAMNKNADVQKLPIMLPLINSDRFLTAEEKKQLPAEVQSALYTQYQIMRLMKEIEIEREHGKRQKMLVPSPKL
jgi:hypothetical protein